MGVKHLWNIISPLGEKKPIHVLQGKVIAIDLSCWVVDSQTVTDNIAQPKMYLRNLFFRTIFLLMQGIFPVFVLEGDAPTLKHKTIAKRNELRYNGKEKKAPRKGNRSNFNRLLSECQKMLKLMGISCVQGNGEAEAMCAYLNEDGLVDGCITQDSDYFLYGGKTAYKNFSMSVQGSHGASGGAVDEYTIEKIKATWNIGRNKMIAMALLCGCDYFEGLNGAGKEAALKLFRRVEDELILDRMKSWRTDKKYDYIEADLNDPNNCTNCGHRGKVKAHARSGCIDCGTSTKCSDSYKEERALILNEISLRKKALLVDDFPNQELIDEFLIRKDKSLPRVNLKWKQPQVEKLVHFMEVYLAWEPEYAFDKVFPLATRWQLIHLPNISLENRLSITNLFKPHQILKTRNIRCVASYEILWEDEHNILKELTAEMSSDEETATEKKTSFQLVTIESQEMVSKCYPEIIEEYESMRQSKKKKNTKKKSEVEKNSLKVVKEKSRRKPVIKNNKKIDDFLLIEKPCPVSESLGQLIISPKASKRDDDEIVEIVTTKVIGIDEAGTSHEVKEANASSEQGQALETAVTSKNPRGRKKRIDELDKVNNLITLNDSFERLTITPKRSKMRNPFSPINTTQEAIRARPSMQIQRILMLENTSTRSDTSIDRMFNELSPDDFVCENESDDLEISRTIEKMCSRRELKFNFSDENKAPFESCSDEINEELDAIQDEKIEKDEFDDMEECYVPIYDRLKLSRKTINKKYSLGIDALLNDTDESKI
ncbi:flap endonuclease GEN [Prorops nasuta]|uniref:flap endonuclease GEN n=1 Tax=Prorops nasuta TaxID=863751 RepID=UPI0034CDF0D6